VDGIRAGLLALLEFFDEQPALARFCVVGSAQAGPGVLARVTYSKFETAPDAPIESFELRLPQGKFSILGVNTGAVEGSSLCKPIKTVTVSKKVTKKVHGRKRKVTLKVKKNVAQPLTMPTTITAHNGAVLKQETKIAVTGCPKPKPATKTKKTKKATKATKTRRSSRGSGPR
jgi:hypothetical protein